MTASGDSNAVELGVKFTVDSPGYISGVRFFKGAGNTGTHLGSLWSAQGALLARATFTGESASGWQQVNFANPVAVSPGTTYLASYYAPNGHYALNLNYFTNAYSNGPLHALGNSQDSNGVYRYAAAPSFPDQTWQASNYWVDIVFTTDAPQDTTAPTVTDVTPAAASHRRPHQHHRHRHLRRSTRPRHRHNHHLPTPRQRRHASSQPPSPGTHSPGARP